MSIYTDSDKKLLEKVFEYKNSKRFSEALKVLKPLEKRFKNDKVVIGLIATIYFERGKYIQSTKYFKRATILNPNSEISSLGLFHSLINVGKFSLAIQELKRYVTSNKYKLYRVTIKELKKNINNFSTKEQIQIKGIFK